MHMGVRGGTYGRDVKGGVKTRLAVECSSRNFVGGLRRGCSAQFCSVLFSSQNLVSIGKNCKCNVRKVIYTREHECHYGAIGI